MVFRKTKHNCEMFPGMLHFVLDKATTEGFEDVVMWNDDGTSFKIHDRDRFIDEIMPQYGSQSSIKYKSFVRQLNMWGFSCLHGGRKCPLKGSYYHEHFVRGKPELCEHMLRVKVKGARAQKKASKPQHQQKKKQQRPVRLEEEVDAPKPQEQKRVHCSQNDDVAPNCQAEIDDQAQDNSQLRGTQHVNSESISYCRWQMMVGEGVEPFPVSSTSELISRDAADDTGVQPGDFDVKTIFDLNDSFTPVDTLEASGWEDLFFGPTMQYGSEPPSTDNRISADEELASLSMKPSRIATV